VNPTLPSWIMDEKRVLENPVNFTAGDSLIIKKLGADESQFTKALRNVIQVVKVQILKEKSPTSSPNGEREIIGGGQSAQAGCLGLLYVGADTAPSFIVNSVFNGCFLTITLYLGMNIPPQFQRNYPLAVKYGAHGFVTGHELMHAFDTSGIKIAGPDDQFLLTQEELAVYGRRVDCLSKQYNQRCYKTLGSCLVSSKATAENVADSGGIKAAYAAFQIAKTVLGEEPPIPKLTNYTSDQLFYMAMQRSWCTRNLPSEGNLQEDHTTEEARITLMLRNHQQFAAAFKCPVGSPMAPITTCEMWGNVYGDAEKTQKVKASKEE